MATIYNAWCSQYPFSTSTQFLTLSTCRACWGMAKGRGRPIFGAWNARDNQYVLVAFLFPPSVETKQKTKGQSVPNSSIVLHRTVDISLENKRIICGAITTYMNGGDCVAQTFVVCRTCDDFSHSRLQEWYGPIYYLLCFSFPLSWKVVLS